MTDQQFLTQLLSTWNQYTTWLATSQNLQYGEIPDKGCYGGGVSPNLQGFMKWIEFIYLPAQPPA